MVPASGVDVVELEDEGTCVRFSPLQTAAGNRIAHTHPGKAQCVFIFYWLWVSMTVFVVRFKKCHIKRVFLEDHRSSVHFIFTKINLVCQLRNSCSFTDLGTQPEDVDILVEKLLELVPLMTSTMSFRQDFKEETHQRSPYLRYVEELSWPGLGAVR